MNPKVFLSPLSGITDLPFRLISREFGARFCFLEMIDANSLTRSNRPKAPDMLKTHKKDTPIAGQLLGAEPSRMLDAAFKLQEKVNVSFLDINSGCPVKKVIKKKAGSYLLKDSKVLARIVKKLASNLKIPVTVKMRTGFTERNPTEIAKIAKMCQENGAATLFVHGRTSLQGYSGEVDYESIKAVKDSVSIPVFGSGNIFNPIMAKKMLEETGCDGILVARGALGNPWIFRDIETYLKTGRLAKSPSVSLKKKILKKHLSYIEKYREMRETSKAGFMGKIAMWYLKGFPGSARVRESISRVRSYGELIQLIDKIK